MKHSEIIKQISSLLRHNDLDLQNSLQVLSVALAVYILSNVEELNGDPIALREWAVEQFRLNFADLQNATVLS